MIFINTMLSDYRKVIAICLVMQQSNIFFKRSINSSSFQDTINLSDNLGNSLYPQVATSAGNVYVIWKNDNSNFGNQIFFKRSTDSGYSFGRKFSTVDISNTTASIGFPQIEADGRYVNIIWSEKNASNGNWQLWFTRSVNSGDFSGTIANTPKIVLSDATKTSDSPQIAVGYGNNTYQGNGVFAV